MRQGLPVLLCDDEAGLRDVLALALRRQGYAPVTVASRSAALAEVERAAPFPLVVTDLSLPDGSGMEVLEAARAKSPHTQVVMMTGYATTEQAVEAMRKGAYDYLRKPFSNQELFATLEKAAEKATLLDENRLLRQQIEQVEAVEGLYGKSPSMQRILSLVRRAAGAAVSVLITGESGTGKEVAARAIHRASARKDAPFVVVNCGAIPEALIESEFFGHEKGAFTGANEAKPGLFRAADGGSLFLDEVGELPLLLQVRLLRVLQEKKVRPVGGNFERDVDVRIIAATNRDLEEEVAAGRFRQDLFYRLNVVRIGLPALRERRDDIAMLARLFLEKHRTLQRREVHFAPEALSWLMSHDFPGNVRELENLIERAVALCEGERITPVDFLDSATQDHAHAAGSRASDSGAASLPFPLPPIPEEGLDLERLVTGVERHFIEEALRLSEGNKTQASSYLGLSFRAFRYRLAKYGMHDGD